MRWVNHVLYCSLLAPCGLCIIHTVVTDVFSHWKGRRTSWHGPFAILLGLGLGYLWLGVPDGLMVGLWAGAMHLFLDSLGGRQLGRNLAALAVIIFIYWAVHKIPCL